MSTPAVSMLRVRWPSARDQRGVAAVEFALISIFLFTLLFGAIEVGRVMWVWNAAAEATRLGARRAAVCGVADQTKLQNLMKASLGLADTSAFTTTIEYDPVGCDNASCLTVTAKISGTITTFIPAVTFAPTLPSFRTTLPRESMDSTNNSVCSATL